MAKTESYPNKIQRREMFGFALTTAELIAQTTAATRPKGTHAYKRKISYTPDQAEKRKDNFLEVLRNHNQVLPLVVHELLEGVEGRQREDGLTVDVAEFPQGTLLPQAAGALAIMATGLNRFVATQFQERELSAGPDEHYEEVMRRFTTSHLPLEATRAYRHASAAPPQEASLFDSLDSIDTRE